MTAPTWGHVVPARDAYVDESLLLHTIRAEGFRRGWRVRNRWRTIERADGSWMKTLEPIQSRARTERKFRDFLRECKSYGCERPGTYHDPVYSQVQFPRLPWSVNALFAGHIAGAWNQALSPGVHAGPHYVYDVRSAYLSSLTLGLPDPATYRYSERVEPNGLYLVQHTPRAGLPYPYASESVVCATTEEIARYDLREVQVIGGLTWSARLWVGTRALWRAIRALSFWRFAARAYWGRWAMRDAVDMIGGRSGTVTSLRSIYAHHVWAHLIVGRLRMRLWRQVERGDVLHVFTDSIITSRKRITCAEIGGWQLARQYPQGVYIRGTGQYGPMYGDVLDKHAGLTDARIPA